MKIRFFQTILCASALTAVRNCGHDECNFKPIFSPSTTSAVHEVRTDLAPSYINTRLISWSSIKTENGSSDKSPHCYPVRASSDASNQDEFLFSLAAPTPSEFLMGSERRARNMAGNQISWPSSYPTEKNLPGNPLDKLSFFSAHVLVL